MDEVSDAAAARMLANKQRRAKRKNKLNSYGTKAQRKQYAITNNLHRPPPRRQNVAATQHQRDQNNLNRKIADAQAKYNANNTEENHDHLMRLIQKLTHVVHQDDAHPATHATTEHPKKRSKKSKAKRERAEEHRQYFAANPLTPAAKMQKAAESKARRDAAGGDEAYKAQKKARRAAERLARDDGGQEQKEPGYESYYTAPRPSEPTPGYESYHGQYKGVPNAYAID